MRDDFSYFFFTLLQETATRMKRVKPMRRKPSNQPPELFPPAGTEDGISHGPPAFPSHLECPCQPEWMDGASALS